MKHLIVTNPFAGLEIGARVAEPDRIAEILAGEHAQNVVAVEAADGPAPGKAQKSTPQE